MKKLYFAYGSNMSQSRLEARVGKVKNVGTHRLYEYKLMFNCGSGFANIVPTGMMSDFVEGVVYEMTAAQMRKLDKFEGLYLRLIEKYQGKQLTVYICINPRYLRKGNVMPAFSYIEYLVDGARDNGLRHTLRLLSTVKCHLKS